MFRILMMLCFIMSCSQDEGTPQFQFEFHSQFSDGITSLRALHAFDEEICVSSGSGNKLLLTQDGGEKWIELPTPDDQVYDFRDISLIGDTRILLMTAGQPAKLFYSDDQGNSYSTSYINENPKAFFNTMTFWNGNAGIAFSDPTDDKFLLVETNDGGAHWFDILYDLRPLHEKGEAGFAASGTMMTTYGDGHVWFGTGGSVARIFYSSDYGSSWTAHETPMLSGKSSQGIFSVCFKDSLNGIVVGGDYTELTLRDSSAAWTNDGGKTWQLSDVLPFGFRSCVDYVNDGVNEFYICTGPSGTDYSIDDGKKWTHIDTLGFHSVSVAKDGKSIWLSGSEGRISRLSYKRK